MKRVAAISCCLLLCFATAQDWELRVCADAANLPFSNEQGEGFENAISELLAAELNAVVEYVWLLAPHAIQRNRLVQSGECDVALGVVDGNPGLDTTLAYYRSSYVFVYRADADFIIESLDDPVLQDLRIGLQIVSGESISPPAQALASRGLLDNQVGMPLSFGTVNPLAALVERVATGDVDVAILWGPPAAYFAEQAETELRVTPVRPEIDLPFLPMTFPIAMGVRPGDSALRDTLSSLIAGNWDAIQDILRDYHVPQLPLPQPVPPTGAY